MARNVASCSNQDSDYGKIALIFMRMDGYFRTWQQATTFKNSFRRWKCHEYLWHLVFQPFEWRSQYVNTKFYGEKCVGEITIINLPVFCLLARKCHVRYANYIIKCNNYANEFLQIGSDNLQSRINMRFDVGVRTYRSPLFNAVYVNECCFYEGEKLLKAS